MASLKLGALQRLCQKIVRAHPHRLDHGFAIGVIMRCDHVEIGRGLLEAFERFQRLLRIAGEIEENGGIWVAFEILQYANVEVRGNVLIFGRDFGGGNVQEVVANHFAEVFVAGGDH